MNAQFAVLALMLGALVAFALVATFPRWFVRPILRDKLLRLLDDIDWDRRDGHLPANDKAVLFLRDVIVHAVVDRSISTIDVVLVAPRARRLVRPAAPPRPVGFDSEEKALYDEYQRRFDMLVPAYVMLGSWSGFVFVIVQAIPVMFQQLRYVRARRAGRRLPPTPVVPREFVQNAVDAISRPSLRAA